MQTYVPQKEVDVSAIVSKRLPQSETDLIYDYPKRFINSSYRKKWEFEIQKDIPTVTNTTKTMAKLLS